MRRFQVPVLHFLRARGGGTDAEDLLQDTFLRAYANLHRYRRQWRFATWLFTIARRLCINHHRRVQPEPAGPELEAAASAEEEPAEAAMREEQRRSLWAIAARTLSEKEFTALWLHYVEDLPVQEVARVLQQSRVAVKTMMFRARKKLVPRLSDMDDVGLVGAIGEARCKATARQACAAAEVDDVKYIPR
jgi:RNA polymerase sigma-70 factor (ECF subfamily)